MRIDRIEIQNFRNFKALALEFHPKGNLFLGRNGAGKTNLLEAIYTLALAKSYRGESEEVIQFGENFFRIKGFGKGIDGNLQVEISSGKNREGEKRILRNGIPISLAEWVGSLLVISLSLEDGEIIRGAPDKRRQFLNILLSLFSRTYLQDLLEYRRVLRQRNRLLQEGKEETSSLYSPLEGWNQQLVMLGSRIMAKRIEMIQKLSDDLSRFNRLLSGDEYPLSLTYKPSFGRGQNSLDAERREDWEKEFWKALERVRKKEREWRKTLVGPHLDDLKVQLNGIDLRHFGSEGEQRTAVLALKLAMAKLLEREKKASPILLLDEVVAELDENRSMNLLSLLLTEYRGQVFIATVKEEKINIPLIDFRRFQIEKGCVLRIEKA